MKVMEWAQECKECKGTGLYVGFAEGRGGAVVCHTCGGTGEQKRRFEFEDFTGRKKRPGVTWVYAFNPGIGVDNGVRVKGGVSLEEWEKNPESVNALGKEMRSYTCPAWWYQTDYEKKPKWHACSHLGAFPDCFYFVLKDKCWEEFDEEQGKKSL